MNLTISSSCACVKRLKKPGRIYVRLFHKLSGEVVT